MPVDLFKQNNVSSDNEQPIDLFEHHGISVDNAAQDNTSQIPPIPNVPQSLPYYNGINNSGILNFFGGASDETNNMLRNALNMLPGVKLQQQQTGSGTAYDAGKIAGDIGAFAAGGEGLEAASNAAKALPYLGKIAQFIGKPIANSAIVGGTIGSLQNPNDKLQNAAFGALLGGGGQAAFEGAQAIPSILQKLRPTPVMSEALEKIPDNYLNNKAISEEMYDQIFNELGNLHTKSGKLSEETLNHPKIERFYEAYKEDPTIENAHILQSQAQKVARNISGNDYETNFKRAQLFDNSEKLKNAIKKSLGSKAQDYTNADSYFRNKVVPYEMISNKLGNLISSQKNPQTVLNSIEKVIKNKAYPTEIIDKKKVPILPEDIKQYITQLNSTIKNKKSLQKLGLGAGAAGVGLEGYHLIKSLFGGG